jgi:hypothetical protein
MTGNKQILTISCINHEILFILFLHMKRTKSIFMLSEVLPFVTKPTFLKRTLGNETVPINSVHTSHVRDKK